MQTQSHLQSDPNTPVNSFPDGKGAPQPGVGWEWLLEQWWAGARWSAGGGGGAHGGGCWGRDVGDKQPEEQAQHKESGAAPSPWWPVRTSVLVTLGPAEAKAGDGITQWPQSIGEQAVTGASVRGEGAPGMLASNSL